MKHPSNWIQEGSIDSGIASEIPFYEKDKALQECGNKKQIFPCKIAQIASLFVSLPQRIAGSSSEATTKYDLEKTEAITIDGYEGKKISGIIKSNPEKGLYIGKPGEKEIEVIIPRISYWTLNFSMVIRSDADNVIFNEILKTIDFNF